MNILKLAWITFFLANALQAQEIKIGLAKQSFGDFYLQSLQNQIPKKTLNQKFMKAVKIYESKKAHESFRFFKEITDIAYQYDWGVLERKAIAYSFLRLAEQDPVKESFYINESLKFAKGDEIYLGNFSKQIANKLQKQKIASSLPFSLFQYVEQPKYVLLNGTVIPIENYLHLELPSGKLRLTIISDSFYPFHFTGDRKTLLTSGINQKKLNLGSCITPKLPHPLLKAKEFQLSFHEQCQLTYRAGAFERLKSPTSTNTENILYSRNLETSLKPEANNTKSASQSSTKIQESKWKKYAWWTLGFVATVYFIENNNKKKTVIYK